MMNTALRLLTIAALGIGLACCQTIGSAAGSGGSSGAAGAVGGVSTVFRY